MNSLLIVNPASGQGKAAREKRKLLEMVSNMPHIHAVVPKSVDETLDLARNAAVNGYDCVLAAGGDGTINCVINGIGTSGIPLGLIPLGTGNVLAHDLGLPYNDIHASLDVIEHNHIRSLDLGRANGRLFVLMAGFGFDAEVADGVIPEAKGIFGTMAYAGPIIEKLFTYTPAHYTLTMDNGPAYQADAYAVVVANCPTFASSLQIAPHALLDDGMLDVIVFESGPGAMFRFVGQAIEVFFQEIISDPCTSHFKCASLTVESEPKVKMQVDGDVWGESSARIDVLHKALKLIVPPRPQPVPSTMPLRKYGYIFPMGE